MSDDWPAAGTLLAFRYRLVSRLETGGMAEIWHAQDELLARPVALKLPTGLERASTGVLRLAWREARMGARLSHPNIAAVHDYDEAVRPEGAVAPFVVMELLAGDTLAARLEYAPLPWRAAAGIGAAVAAALTAAHSSGVVHRDIKPGNVMLTPTGVKILDFGISAVAGEPDDDETGATFGTPAYVAPERLDGKPAEPATDVYGLGVLLFEMVTGQPPYPVDTWEELAQAREGSRPELPAALPPAFRDLVARCLVDEPDRRPTAAEVLDILAQLAKPAPAAQLAAVTAEQPMPVVAERLTPVAAGSAAGGGITGPGPAEPGPGRTGTAGPGQAGGGRSGRRRLVLWSSLVAVTVSIFAVFTALGTSRQDENAGPALATTAPPASPARTPASTPAAQPPAAVPTTTNATRTPRTAVSRTPPLDVDVAISRFRSAVEAGQARGQIRADVAVDMINLLGSLGGAGSEQAADQVVELRRKLQDRVDEGSVDAARAKILRVRLADLERSVGAA